MGRGSDTRIYAPRSESSHMFRANHEDERTPTGMEDARDKDARMDRRQKKKEAEEKEDRKIRHIKVRRHHMGLDKPEEEVEEDEPSFKPRTSPSEPTQPAGAGGFLTSLAMQARGPGAAGGEMIQMSEPMKHAWSTLLKMSEAEAAYFLDYHSPEREVARILAQKEAATGLRRLRHGLSREIRESAKAKGDRNVSAGIDSRLRFAHSSHHEMIRQRAMLPEEKMTRLPLRAEERNEIADLQDVARRAGMTPRALYHRRAYSNTMLPPGPFGEPKPGPVDIQDSPIPGMAFVNGQLVSDPRIKNASSPMEHAWSEILKSKRKSNKRRKKEQRAKWRPSTGKFKRPRGGYTGRSGTSARAKLLSRNLPMGRKTGLMRPHLSVEMSHRGIASKQPMSKDPQAYGQWRGYQEQQNIRGQIAPQSGASLPFGQISMPRAPRPRLHPVRAPPIQPPRLRRPRLNRPKMPGMVTMSEDPVPDGDILKARQNNYLLAEARTALREMRQLMRRMKDKDSKKKNMGAPDTAGAASTLPKYPGNNPKQTTRPEGATEDETDARTFGLDPIGYLTGRGGNRA